MIDSVKSQPTMKDAPSSLSVRQGSRVELPCVASAFPLPRYSWSWDGVVVKPDTDSAENNTTGPHVRLAGGNLVVDSATIADSGEYVCTAENNLGSRTTSVRLEVIGWYQQYAGIT